MIEKSNKTRVFVVDDHQIVRRGLMHFINSKKNLTVCGDAEDANSAISKINESYPDIVIVDLKLKGISGIELIKAIRSRYKEIQIMVLSMHEENEYIERSIKAGAMAYVLKSEPEDQIIEAIHHIIKGNTYLSKCLKDRILDKMLWHVLDGDDKDLNILTDREYEIFRLIGKGLNTSQIGKELNLSPSTIGTYRERIKSKLNISTSNELVKYAIQISLRRK